MNASFVSQTKLILVFFSVQGIYLPTHFLNVKFCIGYNFKPSDSIQNAFETSFQHLASQFITRLLIKSQMADNHSEDNDDKRLLTVRVVIQEGNKTVEEVVEDADVSFCLDEGGNLFLRKLVMMLKQDFNFSLENKEIYYYLASGDIWVNCGIDPISEDMRIRPVDWENSELLVRGFDLGVSLVHRLMSFENLSTGEEKDRTYADEMAEKSKCRRTKQRRIGHIIDKVIEWRKFYSGVINEKNQQVRYSLEDSARQVKISKKSLDDYLFQIRFGHRYGFNFNEHYNDKVGVLRDFVRQRKKSDKTDIKSRKQQQKQPDKEEE